MPLLTKDQILKADDLPNKVVEVPEWGGSVCVRTLRGHERDQFESHFVSKRKGGQDVNLANIRARMVSLCVVGEDGQRLFSDQEVEALGQKSSRALDRLFGVAQELSGLKDKDVEDMAKN